MNRKFAIIIIIVFMTIPVYAQDYGKGGPIGIKPFVLQEEEAGFTSPEKAKESQQKKLTWFEKQKVTLSLADKKNVFQEKSLENIYKRMKDEVEWNKNYTLQRFIEMSKKAEEIGLTVSSYGEYMVLQKNGSYIRYFDGRPTDIFNQTEKDNYGNDHKVNMMNISFSTSDQFVPNYDNTTLTHVLEYINLDYDPFGAVNYVKFGDATYNSNISDRPSEYTTEEGAVIATTAMEYNNPKDVKQAKELYDKLVNEIIPSVESALTQEVTTTFSNIKYYTLAQDNATATTPGGVYGEKADYDYALTSTSAPSAPETGSVSNVQYYLLNKINTTPLDPYWWHAQDASLINLHHNQEAKEASSQIISTTLGITKEIDFFGATYDSHNSITSYTQAEKINGTEIGRFYYHNIAYDNYGRQTSYSLDGNTYGLAYTRSYSGITYDALSRITGYSMNETIDGVTTAYIYYDMMYNNLWQLSDYFYSVDGVEHHIFDITYNSYGLVESYTDVSVQNGITTTIQRFNTYNSNGLLTEYIEYELRQSDTVHEFDYTWVGNIVYNSIYAISSFDQVVIRDTNATEITNYASTIPTSMNSLIFDGVNYTLNAIDMIALGFNANTTIYSQKWLALDYYTAGSSIAGYYNFTLDTFRGRLKSYSSILRTTTITSDSAVVTIL